MTCLLYTSSEGTYTVNLSGVNANVMIIDDSWNIYGSDGEVSLPTNGTYYVLVQPEVGTFELSITRGSASSTATTINTVAGKIYEVSLRSNDMTDFTNVEYTLKLSLIHI